MAKEYPLILKGDLVRAILDGRKTQTRRPVKPMRSQEWLSAEVLAKSPRAKPVIIDNEQWGQFAHPKAGLLVDGIQHEEWSPLTCIKCPFGKPGDQLWIRENWQPWWFASEYFSGPAVLYQADKKVLGRPEAGKYPECQHAGVISWKPSIHMPRWASRINLENVNIRVERVQDISEEDALAEGVNVLICPQCGCGDSISHGATIKSRCGSQGCGLDFLSAIEGFRELWESIYPGSWDRNDWVWVSEFKRVEV